MNVEFGGSPSRMSPGGKYVDLAELSLSGSLVPSVPTKLALKYNPPMLTIVYHFEQSSKDLYYHEIGLERSFVQQNTTEDLVSHLYVTQAYYFNPKQVKRSQLVRLMQKLKDNLRGNDENEPMNSRYNFFEQKRNVDRTGGRNPLQKRRSFD
jgi:hypothetical protein